MVLKCQSCHENFVWTEAEQAAYAYKKYQQPRKCRDCRTSSYKRAGVPLYEVMCEVGPHVEKVPFRPEPGRTFICLIHKGQPAARAGSTKQIYCITGQHYETVPMTLKYDESLPWSCRNCKKGLTTRSDKISVPAAATTDNVPAAFLGRLSADNNQIRTPNRKRGGKPTKSRPSGLRFRSAGG